MNDLFRTIRSGPIPFTSTVLALNVITALIAFFSPTVLSIFARYFIFLPVGIKEHFWTVFTYPFIMIIEDRTNGLFNIIFAAFFFWMSGGSLERSWGSWRFAYFFIGTAIAAALCLTLGVLLLGKSHPEPVYAYGFYLPLGASIVGFCSIDPRRHVCFMFLPIEGRYVSIIAVAATWIAFGPIYGLFACGGCLAAYLYVTYGRSWASAGTYKRHDNVIHLSASRRKVTYLDGSIKRSPFDIIGKWRDAKEKRRLERLLRNSGLRDPEDDENRS